MRNKPSKQNKLHAKNVPWDFLVFLTVLVSFVAYLAWFLGQPSAFGFQDEAGNTLNRLADLLLSPQLVEGLVGEGQPLNLIDRLPLLFGLALWVGLGLWIGGPLAGRVVPRDERSQYLSLSILSGWTLISTATLLVGLAGGLHSRIPLLAAVCGLLVAAGLARRLWPIESAFNDKIPPAEIALAPSNQYERWLLRLIPVATTLLAVCYLLGSMVPPWEFDVIEYHLQGPKEFLQQGRIDFSGHNVYINMPLGSEMHSLAAMVLIGGPDGWWWGGLLGKTIIGVHSLLAAAMMGSFVGRHWGKYCGWAAAGLLLAAPGNAHVAMAGLIDMVLGTYLIAMLIVMANIWSGSFDREGQGSKIFLLGLLAGGAAACKYPGFLFAVLPCGVVLTIREIRRARSNHAVDHPTILRTAGVFSLALSLTCFPWLAKNWALADNPVYPLAYSVFEGRQWTPQQADQWTRAHSPQPNGQGQRFSLGNLLDSLRQLIVGSPFLNPSLSFLAILGMCVLWRDRRPPGWLPVWLGIAIWILLVWWLATHRIDRFWLPALPIAGGFSAYGLRWLAQRCGGFLAGLIGLGGILLGLIQVASGIGPTDNRYFVSLAAIERESLVEQSTGLANPATAWINRNLNKSHKILSIGEVKAYLYRVPIEYATCFNATPGEAWLADQSPQSQLEGLQSRGFTHLMIDWFEVERYRSPGNYGFGTWPQHADIDAMVEAGILTRANTPFDPLDVEILEVVGADSTDRISEN